MFAGIAIAQIDVIVGDVAGNVQRIRHARDEARSRGAKLVIFPELAICGYPPEDLMLTPSFRHACMEAVRALAKETADGPAIILGSVWEGEGKVYNTAMLLAEGVVAHIQPKRMLPNYGVFDEKRIFDAGESSRIVQWSGHALGLLVCEDAWHPHVAQELKHAGAQLLVCINASPFELGKQAQRCALMTEMVRTLRLPLVYVNLVGAQDDIVFDGASFALSASGEVVAQCAAFEESVALMQSVGACALPTASELLWSAACLGLRDYVNKNGFKQGVLLGLSGGIDSALAAALAVDALGPERVLGVLLPSHLTARESNEDALETARLLGIETLLLPIKHPFDALADTLIPAMQQAAPQFSGWREHLLVGGNMQSRLRGVLLMALSNATGRMLLSTSNKSEVAVGYSTLYGDSCGGYAPLKDLYKTQVYALAHWRNAQGAVIPARSIHKAPTAELAPNQTDQDQLPPYETLDAILKQLIENHAAVDDVVAAGFDRAVVEKVANMVKGAEYKRRQMPPGPKLSSMHFNRDWRMPLTNGFKG